MENEGNDIPGTHKAFERWMADQFTFWPADLVEKATRARTSLWQIENNPPITLQQSAALRTAIEADLSAFSTAYAEWKQEE